MFMSMMGGSLARSVATKEYKRLEPSLPLGYYILYIVRAEHTIIKIG